MRKILRLADTGTAIDPMARAWETNINRGYHQYSPEEDAAENFIACT
jgi:hypothetical protein